MATMPTGSSTKKPKRKKAPAAKVVIQIQHLMPRTRKAAEPKAEAAPKVKAAPAPKKKVIRSEPAAKKAARDKRVAGIKLLEEKKKKRKETRKKVFRAAGKTALFAIGKASAADKKATNAFTSFFKL